MIYLYGRPSAIRWDQRRAPTSLPLPDSRWYSNHCYPTTHHPQHDQVRTLNIFSRPPGYARRRSADRSSFGG